LSPKLSIITGGGHEGDGCLKSKGHAVASATGSWFGLLFACSIAACGEPTPARPSIILERDAAVGPHADGAAAAPDASSPLGSRAPDAAVVAVPGAQLTARVSGLIGSGLRLRTASGEELSVTANGEVRFSERLALLDNSALSIVQQPTLPTQTCSALLRDDGALAVTCVTNGYSVGGSVSGLAGRGLVLSSSWGESLSVDTSGSFRFREPLRDLEEYAVTIASTPATPRQSCTLARGQGRIEGREVADLAVVCTTRSFGFSGTVQGLLGKGLVLEFAGGETVAVARDGAFELDATLPDGSAYELRVKQQPQKPEQRCLVVDGAAKLAGDDAKLSVLCGALGGLRISEVGSCHFANSACWIELYNGGTSTEELSYYQLRSQSAGSAPPYAVSATHDFALPSGSIAPGGRLVVRARSDGALPDGQGVFHISDGAHLPWWSGDGFVELLTATRTVDFVRFGGNDVAPTTASAWKGGAAALLPSGAEGYGYALARDLANSDTDRPTDWSLRSFATPGGPNDVSSDVDSDADGVADSAEVSGGTFAGLDLYAMGARVGPRDLFVEIDHMDSSDAAVLPRREALEKLVKTFAARGIAIHFDVGSLFTRSFDPAKFNLGGGNEVPFAKAVGFGTSQGEVADLYSYKAAHMAAARRSLFYYTLFAWSQNENGSGGSSGLGERPGNDTMITLGGWGLDANTPYRTNLLINYQAATLMHELGHNLGLRHGGGDDLNRKPNYVSVMNYLYSPLGLPTIGRSEGDRYDIYQHCSIFSVASLTNPPTGSSDAFVVDFSDGDSGDLLETSIVESDGLGRLSSRAVDYNCNGKSDGPYARDLNDDGRKELLMDHDDWSNLELVFRRSFSGNENGPSLWLQQVAEVAPVDMLTDDTQPLPKEPCPRVAMELARR
jgi:hypothetical protein